jgi:hypothetical protein
MRPKKSETIRWGISGVTCAEVFEVDDVTDPQILRDALAAIAPSCD